MMYDAIAAAIQDCPMGSTKLQELLTRMNCPPPSRTSMQKNTLNVGKELLQLNRRDMAEKLEIVKATHRERGLPENEINVTVNGRIECAGKKEAWLRGKGFKVEHVECLNGHKYCTANLHRAAPLSKYETGKVMCTHQALQDILVKKATTDGRAAKGIDDATRALHLMWKVERLADYVHLGQSQLRTSLRAQLCKTIFYGRTKEEKKKMNKAFSQDVK
ncbi:unnamed protein product [Mytilus coruscus]|uniref:Mutator-like transposase domain-containing protein n=1 Tax=Mytilus coruscus TaxID=42192 RepID=A0A6J8CEG4_MYTCO|nr:unnamed protein product [Mytilus coruscus]